MARAIWTGSINFGLVVIPVELFSATEDHTIHFHQFQRGTADRIRYQRVNERTGKEVAYADIVKGKDIGGGEYVIVEAEELESILPGRASAPGKELDLATGLIESMSGPWRPEDYHDTYRERVEQLIDDKRRGREVVTGTNLTDMARDLGVKGRSKMNRAELEKAVAEASVATPDPGG